MESLGLVALIVLQCQLVVVRGRRVAHAREEELMIWPLESRLSQKFLHENRQVGLFLTLRLTALLEAQSDRLRS